MRSERLVGEGGLVRRWGWGGRAYSEAGYENRIALLFVALLGVAVSDGREGGGVAGLGAHGFGLSLEGRGWLWWGA